MMLVLGRKIGEEIIIAGVVSVKVLEIRSGVVKLGIVGPKDVPVMRKELTDGSRQSNPKNPSTSRSRS